MTAGAVRVVKVGGSLLDLPGLPQRLRCCLAEPPHTGPTVLLAGGGEFCDSVRRLDGRFGLGDEVSHGLCLQLLDVTASVLARLLPESVLFRDWTALEQHLSRPEGGWCVLAPCAFLQHCEPHLPGRRLTRDWQSTSDSIAARLAEVLHGELLLLKSADPPPGGWRELAEAGYVDHHFPLAAAGLPRVGLRNLRRPRSEASFREIRRIRAC